MPEAVDLDKLQSLMRSFGVRRLYLKPLAANDNSKNQIYLGSDFEALNILPNKGIIPDPSKSIFKAALSFSWIDGHGQRADAPGAQLILYPQYPEVRLSGFLRSCRLAPSRLMTSRLTGRLLFFGVTDSAEIVAYVTGPDSSLAASVRARLKAATVGVFIEIPMLAGERVDSKLKLISELGRIHRLGWITSKRLRSDGSVGPCEAPNCGGYTLEAELGVRPNGFSEPDYLGWEIKQHGVAGFGKPAAGAITLLTPEPTGGYYRSNGPSRFIERFGYADKLGRENRWNFGGVHRATGYHPGTGLSLSLEGYDEKKNTILDPGGGIALVSKSGEIAALWSYAGLMAHWNRKHARAAFVPSMMRKEPRRAYAYGSQVRMAEGTDFLRFLKAVRQGVIYYDPGLKLVTGEKLEVKRRNQFRVRSADIAALYENTTVVDVKS